MQLQLHNQVYYPSNSFDNLLRPTLVDFSTGNPL